MKQVLVIEDVDKFKELWQFGKYDWERVLKENSPGNLLAEVKGKVEIQDLCTDREQRNIIEIPDKFKIGQTVYALILDREEK